MRINWMFILGVIFGIIFMGIGILNNKLSGGNYATGIAMLLMYIWITLTITISLSPYKENIKKGKK